MGKNSEIMWDQLTSEASRGLLARALDIIFDKIEQDTAREIPCYMSVADIQKLGFSRSMSYQLLNMASMPVLKIGGRKFMVRDLFFDQLAEAAREGREIEVTEA